ncbi:hypothetical protein LCGC14_1912470, partial [marine sediment metagenome]
MSKKHFYFSKLSSYLQGFIKRGIFNDRRYAVLTYHNFFDGSDTDLRVGLRRGAFVNINEFEKHMSYIQVHCTAISLEEMVEKICRGEKPDRFYVAVTFDDGYEDNFRLALPVLKKYKIHATYFVSTGFVENRLLWPWWDELVDFAVSFNNPFCLSLGESPEKSFHLRNEEDKRHFLLFLESFIKRYYPDSVCEVLE